ncbi:MAG: hypothetical protein IMZ43_02245 [Thermoplasmata archaeon]|nr:hypothetical protein [Thermoplasmata archaeon]
MFPNKKERYHLLSYTEEYKKVQGKGFEPQITGTTTIDRGGIPPYQSTIS